MTMFTALLAMVPDRAVTKTQQHAAYYPLARAIAGDIVLTRQPVFLPTISAILDDMRTLRESDWTCRDQRRTARSGAA